MESTLSYATAITPGATGELLLAAAVIRAALEALEHWIQALGLLPGAEAHLRAAIDAAVRAAV